MANSHGTIDIVEEWKDLKGNFTTTPNYIDLMIGVWNVISWYYKPHMWRGYVFPKSFFEDFMRHYHLPVHEIYYIIYIALFITLLRFLFEKLICKPWVNWLALKPVDKKKFPESAWKCLFYTCTWSYCVYLLHYRYNYFHQFYIIWDDWAPGVVVPFDIKLMYFVQCGFYLHSVYATVYMDYKRKDYYVMLLHHVITMALILVSYATRYHKVGLLVLYVHDITDIWLELTKVLHCCGARGNSRIDQFWEAAATVCFAIFTFCWFLFRLYWYPLKVLYSAGVVTAYRAYDKGCGLYGFFNGLLWMLLGLNLYWLYFILQFLFKVCRGTLSNLKDVREDDDEDDDDDDDEDIKKTSPVVNTAKNDVINKKKA